MPRKSRHSRNYEDEYGDYDEDYDYDYDYDEEYDYGNSHESSSEYKGDKWRCLICTYDNLKDRHACDMCGSVKKISPAGSPTTIVVTDISKGEDLEGKIKFWRCVACTYDNPEHVSACDMCGTVRSTYFEDSQIAAKDAEGAKGSQTASSAVKTDRCNGNSKDTDNGALREDESSSKEKIEEELRTINLNTGPNTHKSNSSVKKKFSLDEYKPETWMLDENTDKGKNLLHLAIVGHVDAGKSTLMGKLLFLMGRVSQKDMHKYEREAKQKGKGSFAYAWVLDESSEERERGVTMTVAVAHFETEKYHVVILDSPGHKDFVPNMIMGASQADAAVLVVDACIGAFEAGMDGQGIGGQTKEHAQLIRSFGVEQLIVVVNKMDAVEYSKERFNFIKSQLGIFLRRCGFKESSLTWIPLSVIENQNLACGPIDDRLKSWYEGPHLLEAIDFFKLPTRDVYRPLRIPISELVQSRALGQVAASGKLEAGAIRIGSKVLVMPAGEAATVKAIEQDGEMLKIAKAGDSIDIGLQGIDSHILMTGGVLCHPEFPVPVATCLELKVAVLDVRQPILSGAEVELHAHHAKEAAKIVQLLAILDPKTGTFRKKAPRLLTANQSALIEVSPKRGICVEEYSNYRALGRVTLRAAGKTIAVGIVTRIVEQQ